MWTMAVNGHCLVHGGSTMPPDTDEQLCLFYTKCLMAHGGKLHEKCHCNGYDCSDNYHRYCKRGPISYPGGRLWKPYLNLLLVYDMSEYTPYPFRVTFEFKYSVKCNGFQGFSDNFELLYAQFMDNIYDLDSYICNHHKILKNEEGPQYNKSCSSESEKFQSYHCPITDKCISRYRIQDGLLDCSAGGSWLYRELCHYRTEFPCLLANVDDPLNFTVNRPCIPLSKIGDSITDCYGGLDERNLLTCSSSHRMKGFDFKCGTNSSDQCIPYNQQCKQRCKNGEDNLLCDRLPAYYNSIRSERCGAWNETRCRKQICRSDSVVENYHCNPDDLLATRAYRYKEQQHKHTLYLPRVPNLEEENVIKNNSSYLTDSKVLIPSEFENLEGFFGRKVIMNQLTELQRIKYQDYVRRHSSEAWICNRGVAVRKHWPTNQSLPTIECLCPPSLYGQFCQYFADRLTIITQLSNVPNTTTMIKIVGTLLLENKILDTEVFHAKPYVVQQKKYKFYLTYPKPKLTNASYSVQFEAFDLGDSGIVQLLAIWRYSIPFCFLPSHRIAKVLDFSKTTKYFHSVANNSSRCPLYSFGTSCNLTYNSSNQTNSLCLNGGSFTPSYELRASEDHICICTMKYYGNRCQYSSGKIEIKINQNGTFIQQIASRPGSMGSVLQLYDIDPVSLKLIIKRQIAQKQVPHYSIIEHNEKQIPVLGILKLHYKYLTDEVDRRQIQSEYFLLYIQQNQHNVNITTSLNAESYCPKAQSLLSQNKSDVQHFAQSMHAVVLILSD
ncbi:unnamed protein product [Rotaria sp. Silwood1]|nr:unnamed protein product [Rotaria sp. Silwood1]